MARRVVIAESRSTSDAGEMRWLRRTAGVVAGGEEVSGEAERERECFGIVLCIALVGISGKVHRFFTEKISYGRIRKS